MHSSSDESGTGHYGDGSSSSSGSEAESSSSSSSSSASGELTEGEVEQLSQVKCSECRRPLMRAGRPDAEDIEVCDGCHRCFHALCCRRRGIGLSSGGVRKAVAAAPAGEGEPGSSNAHDGGDGGLWFHSESCRRIYKVYFLYKKFNPPQHLL